ncbi:MAG: DUF4115 domain-containing protein [Leptolyngbyaceae cyanobacterium bins.59]|nr:DUF4115 domain-containing protein [Leptolyngbyaceae cyanobacterium bins.59]
MPNLKHAIRLPKVRPRKRKQTLQLQNQQALRLSEIGQFLRETRESENVSLEQISIQTKIQQRLLRAIEQGRLEQLPEPVYIQGFIKLYAEALGMDGTQLALTFPVEGAIKAPQVSWRGLPAAQLRPLHLYLLYILLIMGAVNGLSQLVEPPTQAIGRADVDASYTLPKSAPKQSPIPKEGVAPLKAAFPLSSPQEAEERLFASTAGFNTLLPMFNPSNGIGNSVQIMVTLKSQSWLRVVADGKLAFEGVLSEGTQRTWTAQERITVRAGNAGGVLVAFNDGQTKPMGTPGSVEELTFDAKTGAATRSNEDEVFLSLGQ